MKQTNELLKRNQMRVLLVDDDREFSSLLATSLEKEHGVRVHCVATAYDAMDMLLDHSYGLVILDWDLAGMSGFQALKEVDNAMDLDDRMPLGLPDHRTPVVVLSAHDPEKLRMSNREKKHFFIKRILSKRHSNISQLMEMMGFEKVKTAV